MIIYLKTNYNIEGHFHTNPNGKFFKFTISSNIDCNLEVNESSLVVNSTLKSEQEFTELDLNFETMNQDLQKEVKIHLEEMRQSAFYLINLLKYSLNEDWIKDELLTLHSTFLSIDGESWNELTPISQLIIGPSTSPRILTDDTANIIQSYIDRGDEPFVALKHLHRARQTIISRHIWIEATIAAELAIKEFLIRYCPDIEYLLIELPSPPLDKLYGNVLEHYIGEKYPRYNKLGKGASLRNKLIHRPEELAITNKEATQYVELVEDAIYFLLRKLHPHDSLINSASTAKIQLTEIKE
ncbi:hypothetical protein [Guptibacillus hwajinpoensis]|uniref:hypothetical protein n=1 Tax=Guptibacillus hwajinpoensis TaxID=208199 RepID=UPI0037357CFE